MELNSTNVKDLPDDVPLNYQGETSGKHTAYKGLYENYQFY